MAEKEKPLLMKELTIGKKIALAQAVRMPGFDVIVEIIEAGCKKATADAINTNPEEANYDQLIKARHGYAHDVNKFTRLVRDSINFHAQYGVVEEAQQQEEAAEKAVKAQQS